MNQKLIRWIAGTAILPLALSGCQLIPTEETFPEVTYQKTDDQTTHTTTLVKRGDLVNEVKIRGSYVTQKQYNLSFAVGGESLGAIYVKEGDSVKTGDLLMELVQKEPTEEVMALQDKVDTLKLKKAHLEENRLLEQKRLDAVIASIDAQLAAVREKLKNGSTTALRNQETQLVKDRANQVAAKTKTDTTYQANIKNLDDELYIEEIRLAEMEAEQEIRQIRSPIDGIVSGIMVDKVGTTVKKDQAVITVSDMTEAMFRFETDAPNLFTPGEAAVIKANGKNLDAVMVNAEEAGVPVQSPSGMAYIYFRPAEPDPTLTSGEIRKVIESREDVLYLEKTVVKNLGDGDVVYILDEQNQRKQVSVTTGAVIGEYVEIISGLTEGAAVIQG